MEQIVDIPVSGGSFQDVRPGQSSASSSQSPADFAGAALHGFFSHFSPEQKKRDTTSALRVGTASALEPMDAGCL